MNSNASKKSLVLTACAALLAGVSVTSTLAFLISSDADVNTFGVETVAVELAEADTQRDGDGDLTTNTYVMEIGSQEAIQKDPVVTVPANSSDAWVFVKLDESANLDDYLDYAVGSTWSQLADASGAPVSGVYYCKADASAEDQRFEVIAGSVLALKGSVTADMLRSLDAETYPTLSVTAYAMQATGFERPMDAWTALQTA